MPRADVQSLSHSLRAGPALHRRLIRALTEALTRRKGRKVLAHLDNHLLRDIGLDPDAAASEAAKPFWQP